LPAWAVAGLAIAGLLAVVWVLGLVASAIGFVIKLALTLAFLAIVVALVVAVAGGSRR